MRKLVDVPNVDGVTGDYPKGRVRNKSGATPGTTYVEELHGDIVQFFQKLVVDASIVENDLPDNVSNGYQLLEALVEKIKSESSFLAENNTIVNSTISTSELDIVSFTPSATKDFDNIKASGIINLTAPTGTNHTFTLRLYVDGVVQETLVHTIIADGRKVLLSFNLSGYSYDAAEVVKITGQTNAESDTIDKAMLIIDGKNS